MNKYEREIKVALKNILEYVDADPKYVEYAQLIGYLERLLRNCGVDV